MNTKNITVRILTILLLFVIIIFSFIACGSNNDKNDETEAITTSETTLPETTVETTAETTTEATTTTATTTAATTEKTVVTTSATTTAKAVTSTKETTTKKAVDKEYERMYSALKKELKKKDFPKEAVKLFYDVFEYLYKNYPAWRKGYRDLPSREKYITENVINVIDKIKIVYFYDENSEEGKALLEEGSAGAFTSITEDGLLYIGIIAPKKDEVSECDREDDIESFFHEIIHCKHSSNVETSEDYDRFYDIIEEGGASFHMKFTCPLVYNKMASWLVSYNGVNIEYTKSNGFGYLLHMNAYEKLVYLVGYEIMEKIGCFELPVSAAREKIAEKYGDEQAEKFMNTMAEWSAEYENDYQGEKIFNLSLELEKMFLGFMEQDIAAIKTKEEAKKYKPVFDFYINKNLPDVIKDHDEGSDNVTSEYFDTEKLRKSLEEKLR